jgi:cell division protein FtsI (penicillin-binding protein 3)
MEAVFQKQLTDPATRGQPAVLSIDARVQGALEDELMWGMTRAQAKGAAGIVLDVDTGEVMALASLPSFNQQPAPAGYFGQRSHQTGQYLQPRDQPDL